ncbi:UNVERIFIED_CONTAM: hypothetical protein ABIC26_000333 [Paenibacillus sp. PvR008]
MAGSRARAFTNRIDGNYLPERPASRPACPPIREPMGRFIPFPQRTLTNKSLTPDQAMKYEMMNALNESRWKVNMKMPMVIVYILLKILRNITKQSIL